MKIRVVCLALIAAATMLLAASSASADERGDGGHDQALELFEHGEIHSLREVLESIARQLDGDVVGVELIQINDHWVYRLQIVDRQGHRTFVDVEANADVDLEGREDDD
jgi:uncharacterized membrane protein YkoI